MINLGVAVDFRRRMGIVIGNGKFEFVGGILPKSRIGGYGNFEDGQVVGVGKLYIGYASTIEFGNICENETGWMPCKVEAKGEAMLFPGEDWLSNYLSSKRTNANLCPLFVGILIVRRVYH